MDRTGRAPGKHNNNNKNNKFIDCKPCSTIQFHPPQLHRPPPQEEQPPPQEEVTPTAEPLPPSCIDSPRHSVQLTAALQQQLLGKLPSKTVETFDDLQAEYSASEKLLLYEHVLQCTPRQRVSFVENANFAELVANTKREHKKQRRYRKSKLTLQEEMHQLIELQMHALHKQWRSRQESRAPRRRSRSRSKSPRTSSRARCHSHRSHKQSHKRRSRSRSRSRHRHRTGHRKRSRSRSRCHSRRFHRN